VNDVINLTATPKIPDVPDFIEISNVRHAFLDDAIATKGKALVVDVAALSDEAIESIGRMWTDMLLQKAAERREKVKGAKHVSG
jgi:hypothetical protein